MKKTSIEEMKNLFRALDVATGDTVLVFSNASALGLVERSMEAGGCNRGLRRVLGEDGTIIVPTFSFSFCRGEGRHASPRGAIPPLQMAGAHMPARDIVLIGASGVAHAMIDAILRARTPIRWSSGSAERLKVALRRLAVSLCVGRTNEPDRRWP
jgi:hypothetical protein